MWSTNSLWFEVAIVSIIYAVGNILFGHFEERTPKFRRIGKYILTLIIVCLISFYLGRTIDMSGLAIFLMPLVYGHGYNLPKKKRISGWRDEPKDGYYDFRGWDRSTRKQQGRRLSPGSARI